MNPEQAAPMSKAGMRVTPSRFWIDAGGAGEEVIRRGGGDDDQVEIGRFQLGDGERLAGRVRAEHRGRFVRRGDAPLLDAGARDDPLVIRLHHRFQVGIGQHPLRHIMAPAGDRRIPLALFRHARAPPLGLIRRLSTVAYQSSAVFGGAGLRPAEFAGCKPAPPFAASRYHYSSSVRDRTAVCFSSRVWKA